MAPPSTGPAVSTLELFFDLVFVFTITQVAHRVAEAHALADLGLAFLILMIACWMYGGYAWLTNNVGTSQTTIRLLTLGGMAAYLIMALSIPRAHDRDGVPFAVAYLLVTVVHTALFMRAPNPSSRAILGIAPYNLTAAGFVLAAAYAPPAWSWIGWLAAVLTFVLSSLARRERAFIVSARHFAERHGLVILIALGESVVSLGVGAESAPVGGRLILTVTCGFALAAALWWCYFDGDDAAAEQALARLPAERRARVAVLAYGYTHIAMIAGIVAVAAGLHHVVRTVVRQGPDLVPWLLGVGIALFLTAEAWFRHLLAIGRGATRLSAALLALATIPFGHPMGSRWQIFALLTILVGMLVVEARRGRAPR